MTELGVLWDAVDSLRQRLEVLEGQTGSAARLGVEADAAKHVGDRLEQVNHLIGLLESRVVALETTFASIEDRLADIDTMAADTWDRVAIVRRLAMIEDRLMITEAPSPHLQP